MSKVLVIDASYKNVASALDTVFEQFPLDVRGKSVLVKPNILGPYPPERHVNTSPAVVEAVVKRLVSAGGKVTVSDNPGVLGYGAIEESARVSGILDASMGTFSNMATEVKLVKLPGKNIEVNVSREALESDVLVSLPKFKTHLLTGLTGAIKNSFGFVVGGEKTMLHRRFPGMRVFSEMLVNIYRLKVPDIVIMDGIVGMQGNGPTGKSLYPVGKILASDNGVALDAVMAHMMGMKPHKNAMLDYANQQGLGEIDVSRIDISGDATVLDNFHLPILMKSGMISTRLINPFFPRRDHPVFEVDKESCTACGRCGDLCPGGAITSGGKPPGYDYSKCVSCYCCMELCPMQAITLRDGFLARIHRRFWK